MNVPQMHISVQHGVDKINSMHSDLLLPEEIDLELNKNVQRFINQRWNAQANKYRAGFEGSQKRIDDLRTLIREYSIPTVYKGHVFKNTFIDAAFLPPDYMHLINIKSLIYNYKCKAFDYNTEVRAVGDITISMELDHTLISMPGFTSYINAQLVHDDQGSTLVPFPLPLTIPFPGVPDTLPAFITWITTPSNWMTEVKSITVVGSTATVTLIAGTNTTGGATLLEDQINFIQSNGPAGAILTSTATGFGPLFAYADKRINGTDSNGNALPYTSDVSMNKFVQHDDIFKLMTDPFNKTEVSAPLYTIKDNHIEVYTDNTFIVDAVKMTYLKTPIVIDIINTPTINCDLPPNVHQEIVDMTVNSILEEISDPRYQSTNMEILKSE